MTDRALPLASAEMIEVIESDFGRASRTVVADMRPCDDVPRFVAKMREAHKQTARSTLRFGPLVRERG